MSQTREDRMYRMWKVTKVRSGSDYYRKGSPPSPLMLVARCFKVPVQEVREVIEAKQAAERGEEK